MKMKSSRWQWQYEQMNSTKYFRDVRIYRRSAHLFQNSKTNMENYGNQTIHGGKRERENWNEIHPKIGDTKSTRGIRNYLLSCLLVSRCCCYLSRKYTQRIEEKWNGWERTAASLCVELFSISWAYSLKQI